MAEALRVDLAEWRRAQANIKRASERAAMWAVRESARAVARAAKPNAPVYKGPPRTAKVDDGTRVQVVPGEYKKSIRSSKRLQRVGGDGYRVAVGPRGDHVHLYAQKIEARQAPMAKGYAAVRGRVAEIHEQAMRRALRRYAR